MTDPNAKTDTTEQPQDAAAKDPSTNTAPPSNPEVEEHHVREGQEKLERIVNW